MKRNTSDAERQADGRKRVRIEDVARAAGVSIMTVSRALRGVEGVSEARRSEIIRLAQKMNYVPNSNARSLAVENSTLIGISLPTFFNEVFAEILDGMRGTLISAGFETVIDITEYDELREEAWVERMISWRPAGVVLTGVHHTQRVRNRLKDAQIPTLEIWDYSADPIDVCVGIDHHAAGCVLATEALQLGYRKPAFVGTLSGLDLRADARLAGIREVFSAAGLGPVHAARDATVRAFEAGFLGVKELCTDSDTRPDVIFFLNDFMTFGGLTACEELGLDVPGEIGLVGFNALSITDVLPRRMTTARTPRKLMGSTAARNLMARINGVKTVSPVALPIEFIAGDTTCAQASGPVSLPQTEER